jgi:hypothetical protein
MSEKFTSKTSENIKRAYSQPIHKRSYTRSKYLRAHSEPTGLSRKMNTKKKKMNLTIKMNSINKMNLKKEKTSSKSKLNEKVSTTSTRHSNRLFTKEIIESFTQQLPESLLSGVKLLNYEMFKTFFYPPPSFQNKGAFLNKITEICRGIEKKYRVDAINRIYNEDSNYDIIVAVTQDIINLSDTFEDSSQYDKNNKKDIDRIEARQYLKLTNILGFLIVKKGECRMLNNVWGVNLICNRVNSPLEKDSFTIKGQILLGCYLYAIKTNTNVSIHDKTGFLELAGGFENSSAFFAYYKMGFNVNLELSNKDYLYAELDYDLYDDLDHNLPMSIDLQDISKKDIINLTSTPDYRLTHKHEPKFEIKNDYGFFELGMPIDEPHTVLQKYIASQCNELYKSILSLTDKLKDKDPDEFKYLQERIQKIPEDLKESKRMYLTYTPE